MTDRALVCHPAHAGGLSASPAGDWFVVWTASRAEKKVAARLAALGLEVWLPTVVETRKWSDRLHAVEMPLFASYLFVRDAVNWNAVIRTQGVLTVVKHAGRLALVSNTFVQALRAAIGKADDTVHRVEEPPSFELGDEVLVQDGPLYGMRGVVRELRGARTLIVWVTAMGRGVAISLGAARVSVTR